LGEAKDRKGGGGGFPEGVGGGGGGGGSDRRKVYKLESFSWCNFLCYTVTLIFRPNIHLSIAFKNNLDLYIA